jgi:hypothetical protein
VSPVYPRAPLPPPSPFTPTWFESASLPLTPCRPCQPLC